MSSTTPLPTRVNRACDRCRRNKSRCDSYRPCSLCLRANATCCNTGVPSSASRQSTRAVTPQRSIAGRCSKRRRLEQPTSAVQGRDLEYLPRPQPPNDRASASPVGSQGFHDGAADSAISIARKIHTLERRQTYEHVVDAIPGAETSPALNSTEGDTEPNHWASTASYLTHPLPDQATMATLMSEYFESIHWFSLVILEPNFRVSWDNVCRGFASPADKPFLLLLSIMLGLTAWYRAQRNTVVDEASRQVWLDWSQRMTANSETQLVYIMDQRSIVAIQTLILLGSYYVYHGRPNLSFSLLGATIKAAQSIGLHQKSFQGSHLEREERKRVWWTIYTWDRFASINYGRPLGISESGYVVEMPEDVYERPIGTDLDNRGPRDGICYARYQRELNRLYQVASPAIESLHAAAGDHHRRAAKEYYTLVADVTKRLWEWRRELPEYLLLTPDADWPSQLSTTDRAYRLQSLSLYLTFDSLVLILHRPFMKQRLDSVLASSPDQVYQNPRASGVQVDHGVPSDARCCPGGGERSIEDTSSQERLWNAAVRTAKIAELPHLAQCATDGHLVVFVAINLFNASVVLVIMALSNPLADRAQEAKRAVARIYRALMALGDRSTLSQQTSCVLRSLIQLLISRESDAMLLPTVGSSLPDVEQSHVSVREALSQPLWMPRGDDSDTGLQGAGQFHDNTQGLQQGLESVQRAFNTSGFDNLEGPSRSHRASISHNPGPQSLGTYVQPHSTETVQDNIAFMDWRNIDDHGVHWIWDPAWDNMFSAMNT